MTAMTEAPVLRTEHEGILELVLNRPDKLNALNTETFVAIREAVDDLRRRPDLRVLLIRATGRYFSAGVDLTDRTNAQTAIDGATDARTWMRVDMMAGMHALYEEMERVEKPIVIAHHATCVGGALEMSLSCDFRLAARSASYSFPEMKFGMLPLSGGVNRLTRVCGAHWARWMILAGQAVSAERALVMGLVHDVYADEAFDAEVQAFCAKLAQQPVEATAAAKLAITMAADLPNDQARQLERLVYSSLLTSKERHELSARYLARLGGGAPRSS